MSASDFEFTITYTARFDPGELGTQFHEFVKVRESDVIGADDDLTSAQEAVFTATSQVMQRSRRVRINKDVADTEIGEEEIYAEIALRSQQNLDPVVGPDCKAITQPETFAIETTPLQFAAKIIRLKCLHTAGGDSDDVKMQIDGVKVWPPGDPEGFFTMSPLTTVEINEIREIHGDNMGVALFGDTTFGADDRLGSTNLSRFDPPGEHTKELNGEDDAHYQLTYKVVTIEG
ncbi:hypothetical protein AB0F18_39060 [Streptomyces sp. NPDC029216]|uniref:hypothetical protein n=1 Tax=Streptomyces sp. NPDC029216 TaxID=3154701 RepID=UPI0033F98688